MKALKYLFMTLAALAICYLGFVMFMVFEPNILNFKNRVEFDSKVWKDWKETEMTATLRWDMTHSLTKKHELVGMTIEDVLELLGPPTWQTKSQMRYYLGMARHGIDTGSLILDRQNGVIVNFKVRHG